jgi:hypothetical protein
VTFAFVYRNWGEGWYTVRDARCLPQRNVPNHFTGFNGARLMATCKSNIATVPSEQSVLADFWFHVSQTTDRAVRLSWLKKLSAVHVRVKWGWMPEQVRARWNATRKASKGVCFVCAAQKTLVTHHVVQIRFGGSNKRRNRVVVCKGCHAAIHPWMAFG